MTTTQPHNASEWQLYRVLQRANLLQYYDTFIAQGGDDVQQLCEAGEEEFLEIMALVGMASKPLHVRRLQKALQEWVANPAAFQGPSTAFTSTSNTSVTMATPIREQPVFPIHSSSNVSSPGWSPHPASASVTPIPTNSLTTANHDPKETDTKPLLQDPGPVESSFTNDYISNINMQQDQKRHSSSPVPTPVLVESQINAIAQAAARIAKALPKMIEPKALSQKKQINRELQAVMQMSEDDPNRMDLLRKYAAIYGRFDSKRKNDKPMSLHEISVNEASAQLCQHIPALITRREDLFPLARQVVKESGYQYSKGHSRSADFTPQPDTGIASPRAGDILVPQKKPRLAEPVFQRLGESSPKTVKEELDRVEQIATVTKELAQLGPKLEELKTKLQASKESGDTVQAQQLKTEIEELSSQQIQLVTQQTDLIRKQRQTERYQMNKPYNDEAESSLASISSSPGHNDSQDGEDFKYQGSLFGSSLLRSGQSGQPLTQNSLFDEGLRIAQQYGMDDFETELMQLKRQKPEEDETDESGEEGSVRSGCSPVATQIQRQNGNDLLPRNSEKNELETQNNVEKISNKSVVNGGESKTELLIKEEC